MTAAQVRSGDVLILVFNKITTYENPAAQDTGHTVMIEMTVVLTGRASLLTNCVHTGLNLYYPTATQDY